MTGAIREWLAAAIAATMLVSVILPLVPNGPIKRIAGLTGGIIVILVLITPTARFSGKMFKELYKTHLQETETWENAAEEKRRQMWCDEVSDRLEEYIETYSASKGHLLYAEVKVLAREDGIPVPIAVEIKGEFEEDISAWLALELGIPEEQQHWIHQNQTYSGD